MQSRLIEESFDAPLIDMYGVSEAIGATCSECPVCSDFHRPPVVIPEILEPDTEDQPMEEGVGELCITSFVPFQTMQPLIRYRTGDYVRISGVCELTGEIAFRPIGRVTKSLYLDGFGVVLPSGLVYEVIDGNLTPGHLFRVPKTQRILAIPAHTEQNHIQRAMRAFQDVCHYWIQRLSHRSPKPRWQCRE
jgi:hypothetical protein